MLDQDPGAFLGIHYPAFLLNRVSKASAAYSVNISALHVLQLNSRIKFKVNNTTGKNVWLKTEIFSQQFEVNS